MKGSNHQKWHQGRRTSPKEAQQHKEEHQEVEGHHKKPWETQ